MSPISAIFQYLLSLSLITASMFAFAQKPIITGMDKTSAANDEIVTLRGTSFGTSAADLRVSFGASKGNIHSVSDQLLEVKVPAGATYDKISVSHAPSGLTGYTSGNFLFSFGGEQSFSPSSLEGQKDFNAKTGSPKTGLYDLCLCDFDGDGKNDVAGANEDLTAITVLQNTTSGPGLANISFAEIASSQTSLNTPPSTHATCGDLNGDGKPDLIISEAGDIADRVFIYHNISTGPGSFVFNRQSIKLTDKKVKRVKISDLDLDGKPELIITSTKGISVGPQVVGNVTILVNQSTPSGIVFNATPITITIPDDPGTAMLDGASSTDGLAVDDLNGDDLPEIIVNQFLTDISNIFILRNTSTAGSISFARHTILQLGQTVINVKVGDLDHDQKPDIAATQLFGPSIAIFLNQSSSGNIAFAAPVTINTEDAPFGFDFGDLDGDHKTDIVVTSILRKFLTILNNKSTPGNLSFQKSTKPTTYITRHVVIGDVDGDAKPDIAFVSADNTDTNASKISILRNTSCQKPKVNPAGPHTICAGFPLKLTTGKNPGTTYQWKNNGGAPIASGPNASFEVTLSGNYTVTAISEGGTCSLTSDPPVAVTVEAGGSLTGTAIATYDGSGALCLGSTLQLKVGPAGGVGATEYKWTGPNGWSGSGLQPDPINNFRQVNAGRYFLEVYIGSCIAQKADTVVEVVSVPEFQINSGGATVVCPPDVKTLTVSPNLSTFSYEWLRRSDPATVLGTQPTYNVSASGEYFVRAKYALNPACATVEAPGVTITFAAPITAGFILPSTACRGQDLTFTNTTTSDSSVPTTYAWEFGDNTTSSEINPVHRYLTAANFPVKLTASYANGACAHSEIKNLNVRSATLATITTPEGQFAFCPGESLVLEVLGSFTGHHWNTNQTTPSITVTEAGLYSVTVNTPEGCTVNASQEVTAFESPEVVIESNPAQIAEGQTATLSATGLQQYTWEPVETLSDPMIPSPVASPLVTTVYTVTGTDVNGCPGEATYELRVQAGSIYGKIKPSPFFSPENGDEFGKFWNIEKIEEFPECQVTVYDEKGVKVHEAKPYENTWDGTFNGQKLPDGVYYFIIKCAGEQNSPKTGSITLLR